MWSKLVFRQIHSAIHQKNIIISALLLATALMCSNTALAASTLNGKVVDAADGLTAVYPVAIDLIDPASGNSLYGVINLPDGTYEFTDVTPGTYLVFFNAINTANGYIDELYDEFQPCNNGGCDWVGNGATIVLSEGGNVLDEDLAMGAQLSGQIVDAADATTPVHPVFISLHEPVTGAELGGTLNNPDGTYETGGFTPGSYLVFFNALDPANSFQDELHGHGGVCPGGACDMPGLGTPIEMPVGNNVWDEDLFNGVQFSGTITEAGTATGIEGVTMGFYDGGGGLVNETTTAADGSYETEGLPPQNYYVVATASGVGYLTEIYDDVVCQGDDCVPVAGSATQVNPAVGTTAVVDFDLGFARGVSGNVVDSDTTNPIEGMELLLFDLDCNFYAYDQTDSAGNYHINVADDGDYYLFASAPWLNYVNEQHPDIQMYDTCLPPLNDVTQGTVIQVSGEATLSGYDFDLEPSGSISGNVADSQGALGENEGQARLHDANTGLQLGVTNTDANGNYHLGGLMPGDFHVIFSSRWQGLIDERYNDVHCPRNSCNSGLGNVITLAAQQHETGIDGVLDAGPIVRGLLTDSTTGNPVPDYCVAFYNSAGIYASTGCSDGSGVFTTIAGLPDGSYTMSNVYNIWGSDEVSSPGYQAQIWTSDGSFRACADPCDFTSGDLFVVSGPGDTLNIDMDMTPTTATLTGTIVDAGDGTTPVHPVEVSLYDPATGGDLGISTSNNPDGSYQFTGLEPGEYKVLFNAYDAANTYSDELYDEVFCDDGSCPIGVVGLAVVLTPGANILDEDLAAGGSISGVISSSVTGQPLGTNGGRARLYKTDGELVATALTDANGSYTFGGVAPGDYFVLLANRFGNLIDELYNDVKCPRLVCDTSAGTPINIAANDIVTGIDGTLDPGSQITGYFLQSDGTPVQFALLQIFSAAGDYAGFARSDENGFYQSGSGFPAGSYFIAQFDQGFLNTSYPNRPCGDPCDATVGELVVVDGTNDATGIDFVAVSGDASTSTVYGTVIADDGGLPIDDVKICAVNMSDGSIEDCHVTDSNGAYLIGGLPMLSDYAVYTGDVGGQAYFGEVYDSLDCCDTSAGTPVDLSAGNAQVDFSLASSGRIAGIVRDSVSGEPIGNVPIYLYDADANQINTIEIQTDDGDFPGQYAISGVPDGIFYVFAQSEWQGYANELYPDIKRIRVWNGDITDGQAIVIDNQTQVDGIDFELDPAGSISGTISDSNGILPFNAGRIRLYNRGDRTVLHQVGNWNGDATYTIPGIPPGTYDVLLTTNGSNLIGERYDDVTCPRNSCDLNLGTPVPVGPQQNVSGIDAELEEGAVVAGIITDAGAGQGVGGFCLGIYTAEGIYAAFACTGQDGAYGTTTGLPPGEYRAANQILSNEIVGGYLPQVWTEDGSFVDCGVPCNFLAGDTFTVTGTTVSGAVNMAMEKGTVISGNVQFGGSALEDATVVLLSDTAQDVYSTQTDASGDYQFPSVGSGDYYVRTLNDLGYEDRLHAVPTDIVCNPDCNPFAGTIIVADGSTDVTGIDFSLVLSGGMSGLVTDSDTNPVAGVTVEAYNALGDFVKSAITNADGEYSIEGLGSGDHYVRSRNILGYREDLYASTACPADCDVRLGTPVPVSSGAVAPGIDLELASGSAIEGAIYIEVSGGGQMPLQGAGISIYDASGIRAAYVNSDANGFYKANGLDAGTYHVVTWNNNGLVDESADGSPCEGSCEPLSTEPVSLGAAEVLNLDFGLQGGGWVPVYVTDTEGNALSGIQVSVYDDQGGEIISRVTQKPRNLDNGVVNAILPGIPPGDVYLKTYNDLNYQDEIFDNVICRAPCDPTEGKKIRTTETLTAEIRHIVLEASNSISGRVYESGTDPATGLGGVGIELYTDTGLLLQSTTAASDGVYLFGGLANGRYRLKTSGNHDFVDQVFGGNTCSPEACDILAGSLVELSNSDRTDADFTLQRGNVLSGYARDVHGNPIAGFSELFNESGALVDRVAVNTSGLFTFRGIADGTYFVYTDAVSTEILYQYCYNVYVSHCDSWTGCHSHCNRRCETRSRYTTTIDTLYQSVSCPDRSCDVTTGQPVVLGPAASPALAIDGPAGAFGVNSIEIELSSGYNIRGSLTHMGAGIANTPVYFFDQAGTYVGRAISDGLGEFVSESGLPNGTYFAATSRTATEYDTPEEAANAEDGVGQGLQDAAWDGFPCDGICAPSQNSGFGTPIEISGADETGINIVLGRAPGIQLEKLTNGVDADTPNDGEAPDIAAGETVNWTYEVTNTGGETLINIVVVDDQGVTVDCPQSTLASDAPMTCTGSEPAKDLSQDPFTGVMGNCDGASDQRLYQNTAKVTAETGGGVPVEDSDSSHYCNPLPLPELIFRNSFE